MDDLQHIQPPQEVKPVQVNLVGGPMDGTGYVIGPNMAVGLPSRLEWFSNDPETGKDAGWIGYELYPNSQVWPEAESVEYGYTGFRSMFNEKLTGSTKEIRS